ncbi:MAG TPA: phage terminase large subunit [Acidobacteriota bacterium]|nr:phage terminase large subunit [Acidobacteriota bacterium]
MRRQPVKQTPGQLLLRFRPLPAQRRFLLAREHFAAYVGGFGSGKTYALCHKAIQLSGHNPGLPGMLVAPTYGMLEDAVMRSFTDILRVNRIDYKLHRTRRVLETAWGGEIWFRSADHPDSLRGPNMPWVGIDEMAYIDRAAWEVLIARVREPRATRRQVFGATTPEGYNWVYEFFVEEHIESRRVIFADTRENIHLPQGYAESLLAGLDEEGVRQYVEGRFVAATSGRVYKHFDPVRHSSESNPLVAQGGERLEPSLPLCIACDFNVDPCIWLLLQHHGGVVYVADEIVLRNTTTQEMIDEALRRGWGRHPAGAIVYGDPAGHARSTSASASDYRLLSSAGFGNQRVARRHAPVRDRINAVNARMRDAGEVTRFFINPRCRALRRDLLRVRYQPGTANIDKVGDPALTHASDALGYFMVIEYPIVRPSSRTESVWNVLGR